MYFARALGANNFINSRETKAMKTVAGSLDFIIMRVMDGLMSIPPLLLAIALMALTRASVHNVVIAISVAEFPRVSRLIRGVVLSLREQPYVEAAIASGTRVPDATAAST